MKDQQRRGALPTARFLVAYVSISFPPTRGRPAETPWRLVVGTIVQTRACVTDRQAAEAVMLVPDPLLERSKKRGWLKAGGKQRTDSTAILAWIRSLKSLEHVGETALNDLAQEAPEWSVEHLNHRSLHRCELARFPKQESKQRALRIHVGEDVQQFGRDLVHHEMPEALRQLSAVTRLRQVFGQHDEEKQGHVQWRDGPAVSNEERIVSPSDPKACSSRTQEQVWWGDNVRLRETCDQDPHRPGNESRQRLGRADGGTVV